MIVTILSMALCGSVADLPNDHCEEPVAWEYVATTPEQAKLDWQACMTRRKLLDGRFSDHEIMFECDQFTRKDEAAQ